VVEKENGVEAGRIILSHVAVRAGDGRGVENSRDVKAARSEMDVVVRLLQRHHLRGAGGNVVVPLGGGCGVRENGVVGRVEAGLELVRNAIGERHAVHDDGGCEPVDDVGIQKRYVFGVVGEESVVGVRLLLFLGITNQAGERIANGFVAFRLTVIRIIAANIVDYIFVKDEGTQGMGIFWPSSSKNSLVRAQGMPSFRESGAVSSQKG